ncbi:anti-sigma factor [Flavihumibacter sp. R14]|nr:anti-sigma factor [Flavihumibacter soli]
MEDLRSYIESGILELYAAGDLNPTERLEVEAMLIKHPTLKTELADIEKSLEKYAKAYSIAPPAALRDKVLGNLSTAIAETPIAGNDIITLPTRRDSFFKYAFAASVALLILSLGALVSLYSRLQESRQQLTALQASNQQFSNRVNFMDEKLSEREQILNVLRNPEYKMVKLKGTKQAPQASMMVAFNPAKKEVMIDMAAMEMPANDTEHQYQLWALVDGKPVDLGVFDMQADDEGMKKMKAIDNAQAFAVTLEPRGGSQSPTMEQMMVMGAI